jgi:hypothetical protein
VKGGHDEAKDRQVHVTVREAGLLVSLEQEDIETELFADEHEGQAEHLVKLLSNVGQKPEATLQAVAALLQIHRLAGRIGTANDQQGTDAYATKMRMWRELIFNLATFALNSCGLDVSLIKSLFPRLGRSA